MPSYRIVETERFAVLGKPGDRVTLRLPSGESLVCDWRELVGLAGGILTAEQKRRVEENKKLAKESNKERAKEINEKLDKGIDRASKPTK